MTLWIDGGCDILMVETIFDTQNAKVALFAIGELLKSAVATSIVIIDSDGLDSEASLSLLRNKVLTDTPLEDRYCTQLDWHSR